MYNNKNKPKFILILLLGSALSLAEVSNAQSSKLYPPFTKWYQDPLGLKPLQLSSAFGFLWGTAAVAASLLFNKKEPAFQKKISAYYETGFSTGYKPPYTCVFQNSIGVMYAVREWMMAGLELNIYHFKDNTNNTWSLGIRPFARWYACKSKKTSLFFEYGAGMAYSLDKFPLTGTGWETDTARTGTRFNLTSKYSIGVEFKLNEKFSLQSGIRHFHLSNGNLAGLQRNPSHDSNGFFVGIIYTK